MRLIVLGGDARMDGAARAAGRAGWSVLRADELPDESATAFDAALLPWPRSFADGKLTGTEIEKARALTWLSQMKAVMHGSGVEPQESTDAWKNPDADEAFLRENAELTAEGAIARAMQRDGRALLHETCMITGFGRIGQELAVRLAAMGAFVIVCVRNEGQMRMAHSMGAHPMALERIESAAAQADVIFNTVPARVLGRSALERMKPDALLIELASAPYGADPALCAALGVHLAQEGGLPGRYAPETAGAALFGALWRMMESGRKTAEGEQADG